MITNLYILFLAIAKAALLTGIGPALAVAIVLELRGVRIVAIGVEKVSASGQLAERNKLLAVAEFRSPATSPARKVRKAVA